MNMEVLTGATFQIEKFDENGTVWQGPEFENTVLNCGLYLMTTAALREIGQWVNLGSSDTPVDVTQTGLQARLYSTNTIYNSQAGPLINMEPFYFGYYRVFQFGIGTCVGTFKEIGASKDNDANYFNRQLIKDANGDPMTITVSATEGLRIRMVVKQSLDPRVMYSKIYKLKTYGATSGDIVFECNGVTRTISLANILLKTSYSIRSGYEFTVTATNPFWTNVTFRNELATLINLPDDPYKKLTHCLSISDDEILIYFHPGNKTDIVLTIQSHTLIGGSQAPELTTKQVYAPPQTINYQHQIIVDGVTTEQNITGRIVPNVKCMTSAGERAGWACEGGYDGWSDPVRWNSTILSYDSISTNISGPSALTTIETPTLTPLSLKYSFKFYCSPGAMGVGSKSINIIYFGGSNGYVLWFVGHLDQSIVVPDVDEFEFNFSVTWGRLVS